MKIKGLTIENVKCFGDNYNYLEELSNINIIIGKNNSGKSTILQLLDLIFGNPQDDFGLKVSNPNLNKLI